MDNVFKSFNDNFFKSVNNITWYDKCGVMVYHPDCVVVIEIDDVGVRDHFNGYWVRIYNKKNGLIFQKFFLFQNHLEFIHRENTNKFFHVWKHNDDIDWYISRPKTTKPMVDVILDFIGRWV
jgi:hypothetical protein